MPGLTDMQVHLPDFSAPPARAENELFLYIAVRTARETGMPYVGHVDVLQRRLAAIRQAPENYRPYHNGQHEGVKRERSAGDCPD
jgi:hypothetical protein